MIKKIKTIKGKLQSELFSFFPNYSINDQLILLALSCGSKKELS
jgi:hypothetical protein